MSHAPADSSSSHAVIACRAAPASAHASVDTAAQHSTRTVGLSCAGENRTPPVRVTRTIRAGNRRSPDAVRGTSVATTVPAGSTGRNGLYDAARLQTYIIPTARDIPEFDVQFVEYPYTFAPPGAKGLGELPMDGLAPAIANAVEAATGRRIRTLPITPEAIFAALHPAQGAPAS